MGSSSAAVPVHAYSRKLISALERAASAEAERIVQAGQLLADTVAAGG